MKAVGDEKKVSSEQIKDVVRHKVCPGCSRFMC